MIISDTHKLVFVHIPKCAGTYIRSRLESLQEWPKAGPPWRLEHPEIGVVDYGHMPLFVLCDHFKEEFDAVKLYQSFALIRDPFTRFASSISQRISMYSGVALHKRQMDEVEAIIGETINALSRQPAHPHLLPHEYIHFQRQVDYVFLNSEQLVRRLYLVCEVDAMIEEISSLTGSSLAKGFEQKRNVRKNRAIVFRNKAIGSIVEAGRPITNLLCRYLSEGAKQAIRDRVYVPRDRKMKRLFEAEHVLAFIRDYYADDIRLYEMTRNGTSGQQT